MVNNWPTSTEQPTDTLPSSSSEPPPPLGAVLFLQVYTRLSIASVWPSYIIPLPLPKPCRPTDSNPANIATRCNKTPCLALCTWLESRFSVLLGTATRLLGGWLFLCPKPRTRFIGQLSPKQVSSRDNRVYVTRMKGPLQ